MTVSVLSKRELEEEEGDPRPTKKAKKKKKKKKAEEPQETVPDDPVPEAAKVAGSTLVTDLLNSNFDSDDD